MKKKTGMNIALLLLPLMAVGMAISPTSVTVIRGQEIAYTSFAQAVEGSYVGWCAPVALLLAYALFGMAVIYGLTKKELWLRLIRNVAFAGTFLAAVPILVQGEVIVIPHVLVAILLGILWAVAWYAVKTGGKPETKEPQGPRLTRQ